MSFSSGLFVLKFWEEMKGKYDQNVLYEKIIVNSIEKKNIFR